MRAEICGELAGCVNPIERDALAVATCDKIYAHCHSLVGQLGPGTACSPLPARGDLDRPHDQRSRAQLFIGGSEDHIMPRQSPSTTPNRRTRRVLGVRGLQPRDRRRPSWEAVADKTPEFAIANASPARFRAINAAKERVESRGFGREVGQAVSAPRAVPRQPSLIFGECCPLRQRTSSKRSDTCQYWFHDLTYLALLRATRSSNPFNSGHGTTCPKE